MNRTHIVRPRAAFTLVEVLIAMALLAMILAAAALACKGAADTTQYSNDKSRSLSQATLALSRLSTDFRRAQSILLVGSTSVRLTLPSGEAHVYSWSGTSGDALTYYATTDPTVRNIVPQVTAFSMTPVNGLSPVTHTVVPMDVQIIIEARYGQTASRLTTSVRPRRNIL